MGSDQQFCLRWNNFQSSLLASLPQLLDADDLTDVTLSAGGRNIRAHRVVLSACSQYFKDLFREMQSFQHPVIVLPQTTFSDLCSLVTFMYSGEVNIYQDQLAGLLSTADVLHIRGLAEVPHANGTPLKKKANEESLHQEPITSNQSLHRKKISGLSPSTLNESHAQTSLGKVNRLEKSGKLISGKKRVFKREELEESEPPFAQVKVEQGIEGIDVESPIINHRNSYHHHHSQVLHPVQPLVAEKQDRTSQGGDSYSLPHPTEEAVGIEGEVGYPEGSQAPATIGTTTQSHHSSSEDSGGGGGGGGNTAEAEHHSLGQGSIQKLGGSNNGGNSSSNSKCFATCFVCGKQLSNQYNLKVHLETHQNVCHSCPVCEHVSRSRDALRKHMAYKHTDDRDRFISWKMSSGMIIVPSNQIPSSRQSVNCPVCGRLITQRRNLKQHMKTHQNHAEGGADKNRMRLADGSVSWLGEKQTPNLLPCYSSKGDNFAEPNSGHGKEWYVTDVEKSRMERRNASNSALNPISISGSEFSCSGDEEVASDPCGIQGKQWYSIGDKRDEEFRTTSGIITSENWLVEEDVCNTARENTVTDVV